jgi:serine/threonine-protein kinase
MTVSHIKPHMPAPVRQSPFKPQRFGRYWLVDQISQGGMSGIFLSKTTSVGGFQKPVVIKKLLPEYSTKSRYVKRFINEARTLAQLNHSNIVQVLDMGIYNGEYYIALEYLEGRNVAHVLSKAKRTERPPSLALALHVTLEVARGLAYAHRKTGPSGVSMMLVHQDVNSFNVMVSYEAEVKIIDFGIAQIFLDRSNGGLPVAGKLLYFSPEQLQRKPIDRRVDIYGTGVLLYELLAGERLVQHQATIEETVRTILEMDVGAKVNASDNIPPELKPILTKAMALNPDDRYPWIDDFTKDLRAVVRKLQIDLDPIPFAVYMKQQFQRERVHDLRRMRRLFMEEGTPNRKAGRKRSAGSDDADRQDSPQTLPVLDQASWPFYRTDEDPLHAESELQPRTINVKAGQAVFHQGDSGSEVYVIRSGRVRLFVQAEQMKQTLAVLGPGDFFGETALLRDSRRPCSAQTEEDSELACIPAEQFAEVLGPDLSSKIIGNLAEKNRDAVNLLTGALYRDTLTRLIHALLFVCRRRCGTNGTSVDFEDLKDCFHLENDSLVQKYLQKLADIGVLEVGETSVLLKDMDRLESVMSVLRGSGKLTLKL